MQNQRTETPADFTVPSRTARSSHQKSCIRKLLLDILQYPQETPVLEFIFEKVAYFQTCKRPQHRCFPVNIAKFLILSILKNICKWLLLSFLNGSLLHGPKDVRSRLYDSVKFRVQVTVFVFKSASLVLKQIPTCIQKPKTNTFDKTICPKMCAQKCLNVVLNGHRSV